MENTANQPLKFWQGTNFWIALVLAVGGLFVGFPEGDARNIVGGVFALIASAGALREKLKGTACYSLGFLFLWLRVLFIGVSLFMASRV